MLLLLYKHLKGSKHPARLLFVDSLSDFNTVQPHVLVEKLVNVFGVDSCLVSWILDVLTNRS